MKLKYREKEKCQHLALEFENRLVKLMKVTWVVKDIYFRDYIKNIQSYSNTHKQNKHLHRSETEHKPT
jgi:hypothetical protein